MKALLVCPLLIAAGCIDFSDDAGPWPCGATETQTSKGVTSTINHSFVWHAPERVALDEARNADDSLNYRWTSRFDGDNEVEIDFVSAETTWTLTREFDGDKIIAEHSVFPDDTDNARWSYQGDTLVRVDHDHGFFVTYEYPDSNTRILTACSTATNCSKIIETSTESLADFDAVPERIAYDQDGNGTLDNEDVYAYDSHRFVIDHQTIDIDSQGTKTLRAHEATERRADGAPLHSFQDVGPSPKDVVYHYSCKN
ncbi:MAG TPA: hypothetical protein VL326_31000 [Kofleriaceae bacterium]|nr:hypothetical protein [Kofleriaceae bacterium]